MFIYRHLPDSKYGDFPHHPTILHYPGELNLFLVYTSIMIILSLKFYQNPDSKKHPNSGAIKFRNPYL
jgi:hypothetical protein